MSLDVCCQVMSTFVKQTNYFAFGVRVKNAINSFESHPGWKVTRAAIEQVGWIFFFLIWTRGHLVILVEGRTRYEWIISFQRDVMLYEKPFLRDVAISSAFMVLWLSNYQCLVGFIKRQCGFESKHEVVSQSLNLVLIENNYIVVLEKMLWFTWVGSCRSLMLKFVFSQTRAIWCQYRGRS